MRPQVLRGGLHNHVIANPRRENLLEGLEGAPDTRETVATLLGYPAVCRAPVVVMYRCGQLCVWFGGRLLMLAGRHLCLLPYFLFSGFSGRGFPLAVGLYRSSPEPKLIPFAGMDEGTTWCSRGLHHKF